MNKVRAASQLSDTSLLRLSTRLGKTLSKRSLRVATAESCTGGFIAKVFTDVAGSSEWFLEGFVTYSNDAKFSQLGVSKATLRRNGAVSAATAEAMARGALRNSGADVALAVTGIAGPAGGSPDKPVGTVWLSWAERSGREVRTRTVHKLFHGDRDTVRRRTVRTALLGLLR